MLLNLTWLFWLVNILYHALPPTFFTHGNYPILFSKKKGPLIQDYTTLPSIIIKQLSSHRKEKNGGPNIKRQERERETLGSSCQSSSSCWSTHLALNSPKVLTAREREQYRRTHRSPGWPEVRFVSLSWSVCTAWRRDNSFTPCIELKRECLKIRTRKSVRNRWLERRWSCHTATPDMMW